ncbi:hypothetical protein DPMN_179638 [Dreissena polymorpha]|uniref:Uncharacterized protein n=1 Tax=Dreissena polymorpha TaxID=45954 RepID=A0A9D4EHG5_DREPO|nr:hypothetical protein DPMN_179638 [Dreissena polymorpha]
MILSLTNYNDPTLSLQYISVQWDLQVTRYLSSTIPITRSSPLPEMAQFSKPSQTQTYNTHVVSMLLLWDRFWCVENHPALSFSRMGKARRSWQLLLPGRMDLNTHAQSSTIGAQHPSLWDNGLAITSLC